MPELEKIYSHIDNEEEEEREALSGGDGVSMLSYHDELFLSD